MSRAGVPGDDGAPHADDATRALWAHLERLHAEMSCCYRDLARETGNDAEEVPRSGQIEVAAGAEQSDIRVVQRTATNDRAPQRKLLSVTALATLLDVDPKTVRRWRDEGKLPDAIVIGGVVRWRPEDVDAWLAEARG